LAKFAAQVPHLRPSIVDILKRIFSDQDDEVRDRAVFFVRVLETNDENSIHSLIIEELPVDAFSLEQSLISYLKDEEPQADFDLSQVVEIEKHEPVAVQQKRGVSATSATSPTEQTETVQVTATSYEETLGKIPQLSSLGKPFKSCAPVYITEEDSDYVVTVVKHIYPENIVFQFNVVNMVESQQLEAVHVEMIESNDTDLEEQFFVEANAISYNSSVASFVCMKRTAPDSFSSVEFKNILRFQVRSIDSETGEPGDIDAEDEEEEYDLQEFRVNISDYMRKVPVSFKEEWDRLDGEEYSDTAQFSSSKNLQECVDEVIQRVGITPMNDATVSKKANHSLYFSGKFTNEKTMLLAVQLAIKDDIAMIKVACRSEDEEVRNCVAQLLLQ